MCVITSHTMLQAVSYRKKTNINYLSDKKGERETTCGSQVQDVVLTNM